MKRTIERDYRVLTISMAIAELLQNFELFHRYFIKKRLAFNWDEVNSWTTITVCHIIHIPLLLKNNSKYLILLIKSGASKYQFYPLRLNVNTNDCTYSCISSRVNGWLIACWNRRYQNRFYRGNWITIRNKWMLPIHWAPFHFQWTRSDGKIIFKNECDRRRQWLKICKWFGALKTILLSRVFSQ